MFPKRVAAKNACRAVAQFIDANPDSSLREVRFVLHPGDKETLQVVIYMVLFLVGIFENTEGSTGICFPKTFSLFFFS